MELPRTTADVDISIAGTHDTPGRLASNNWSQHGTVSHRWLKEKAVLDVVPADEEQIREGQVEMPDGKHLSLIGFDLAFGSTEAMTLGDVDVLVPTLPVLLLLKMISWMDRPADREKDLGDIALILANGLPDEDDRRWDGAHAVGQQKLDFESQSPFFIGWELGRVAEATHIHHIAVFLSRMEEDDGRNLATFLRRAKDALVGRLTSEDELLEVIDAFKLGLEKGQSDTVRKGEILSKTSWRGRLSPLLDRQMLIHDAITRHRLVRFTYQNKQRIAEPHILGVKDGKVHLLTYQVRGESASGKLPNWRRVFVGDMRELEMLPETFVPTEFHRKRQPSRFDRHILVIQRGS